VTRRQLWESLFEFEGESESNVLDVTIYSVRKKLTEAGAPELIRTRRGEGYVLDILEEE